MHVVLPRRDVLVRFEDLAPHIRVNEKWLHDALMSNVIHISYYPEPLLVMADVSSLWDTPLLQPVAIEGGVGGSYLHTDLLELIKRSGSGIEFSHKRVVLSSLGIEASHLSWLVDLLPLCKFFLFLLFQVLKLLLCSNLAKLPVMVLFSGGFPLPLPSFPEVNMSVRKAIVASESLSPITMELGNVVVETSSDLPGVLFFGDHLTPCSGELHVSFNPSSFKLIVQELACVVLIRRMRGGHQSYSFSSLRGAWLGF
ncbi:hypothetical protein L1987_00016 [Smallanthus sonchifolius]|uniref:Uncharacterized protein n=1 Tax=Smallanthus sonchifolius TaxID=185202 RepID=A0ACB9K146_9ASTR|nr:hypothetical protein L1987_00016 [Smallanthus sonchifolius]